MPVTTKSFQRSFLKWFLKYSLTIVSCMFISILGTVFTVWATTTISENISTGDIISTGTATVADLEVSGSATLSGDLNAKTGRGANYVIAASDASALEKAQADAVCDGTADDVEIQAAIDSFSSNGHIILSSGTFYISSPITVADKVIWLQGSGDQITTLHQSSDIAAIISFVHTSNQYFNSVSDLYIYGDSLNRTTGIGIYSGAYNNDFNVRNVFIAFMAEDGIQIAGTAWGHVYENIVVEFCKGRQMYSDSGNGKIIASKFGGNTSLADKSLLRLGSAWQIIGNQFCAHAPGGAGENTIELLAGDNIVSGNSFEQIGSGNNGRSIISMSGDNNVIEGNQFYSSNSTYGIRELSTSQDNIISNNNFRANTFYYGSGNAITPYAGSNSLIYGNKSYIASGEVRTISGSLTTGAADAIGFAWHDPELQDIYIKKVVVTVTTPGGTVGSHLDVGIADDANGTNRGTEFFDDLDLNAAAVYDSLVAGDGGTETKWVSCQDNSSATDGWVVGQILDANASSLVGSYYIEYVGK